MKMLLLALVTFLLICNIGSSYAYYGGQYVLMCNQWGCQYVLVFPQYDGRTNTNSYFYDEPDTAKALRSW